MNAPERQAFAQGQVAKLRGKMFGSNPYPLGTSLSRAWSRGWNLGEEARA